MTRATIAATLVLLAAPLAYAAGDHEMFAAQQELKIAKDHLTAAGTDYDGHRRAAIEHIDRALQEVNECIKVVRSRRQEPGSEAPGKAPRKAPGGFGEEDD